MTSHRKVCADATTLDSVTAATAIPKLVREKKRIVFALSEACVLQGRCGLDWPSPPQQPRHPRGVLPPDELSLSRGGHPESRRLAATFRQLGWARRALGLSHVEDLVPAAPTFKDFRGLTGSGTYPHEG